VPEGLEVEIYRRAAVPLVGREIARIDVDERVAGPGVLERIDHELRGATVLAARRIGKQLLLDTDGPTLGIHFGMTGRIVVDGIAAIDELEYGSGRDESRWDRLRVELADGGSMRVNDPRRWSRISLDPDTTGLGPDLLGITHEQLRLAVGGRRRPIKAVLLDQHLIAGLGNLCVDEVLWHARIAPTRHPLDLDDEEVAALHRAVRQHLPAMLERGGSHRGVVSPALRAALPACPDDGAALARDTVGGRTTVWCPAHQT
jgi:formamidopyrimidine-DNA glycosylase